MDAIYKFFYGLFLQPIQVGLGWKKIYGNKISKCYQQSVELAKLFHEELEQKLFETFLRTQKQELENSFPSIKDDISSKKYCIYIATKFEEWKYLKMKNTTDILFCA